MPDPYEARLKDPQAVLDYGVRWGEKWLQADETIVSSTWTVPAGITKDSSDIVDSGKTTLVWLSGGTVGEEYVVTNHVTTSKNRQDDRSILIRMVNR